MATKETVSKCFIALTLWDILDDMETNKTRGRTRRWIQRRATKGYYNNIVKELRFEDTQGFSDMFRMNYSTFQEVLKVTFAPNLAKKIKFIVLLIQSFISVISSKS